MLAAECARVTRWSIRHATPAALLALAPVATAIAQRPHPATSPRDSLRVIDRARAAQFRFESYRRDNLPLTQPYGGAPCDQTIGRICYWHEDHRSEPPPEPRGITRARSRLLATLAALAERVPADPWIAGQRVRYMLDEGDTSGALRIARECAATRWWCLALRGLALHTAASYAAAGAAFDSALSAMPPDSACRWRDISLLLDDDARETYARTPCTGRAAIERRYWELADPSYAVPGNDRRTEHFARMVLAALIAHSANAYGMRWGDDLREVLIRYGAPAWYTRAFPPAYTTSYTITGHDGRIGYHFIPMVRGDGSAAWDIRDRRAREGYTPPYLDSIADIDAQFAMFRRGDSALVVAVYAADSTRLPGVLSVADSAGATVIADGDSVAGTPAPRSVRRAMTPWQGVVAGIETYDPVARLQGRAREWIEPPRAALSTLLLYDAGAPAAIETLDEALAHALTSGTITAPRRLGVYWEIYPRHDTTAAPDSGDVTVTVTRVGGGAFRAMAEALRIAPRIGPIAVRWRDEGPDARIARSIVLDLSALPAGRYRVSVGAGTGAGRDTAVASRSITLR